MPESDATFIGIVVDQEIAADAEMAAKLEEVCPVDIYADAGGRVEIVDENVDECVLCELCIQAAPPGRVVVKKLYDGTELKR
jgi:NAD-dependent dihydropyrimidine dehydrogenase PreA subunit